MKILLPVRLNTVRLHCCTSVLFGGVRVPGEANQQPKERPRPTWLNRALASGGGRGHHRQPPPRADEELPKPSLGDWLPPPRRAQPREVHRHRPSRRPLEDTDPKGGGRRPKLGAASKFWGTGGTGPGPRDCSPCLAPVETPRPLGRQRGCPRWAPKPPGSARGALSRSTETVQDKCARASPAEAQGEPGGTKLGCGQGPRALTGHVQKEDDWGGVAVAPRAPTVTPRSLRGPHPGLEA